MFSYFLIWLLNSGVFLINLDLVITAEKPRKEVTMKQTTNTTHNSAKDLSQGIGSKDKVSLVA
jgi:hypothetical protein